MLWIWNEINRTGFRSCSIGPYHLSSVISVVGTGFAQIWNGLSYVDPDPDLEYLSDLD
jgi:hypothetical protein